MQPLSNRDFPEKSANGQTGKISQPQIPLADAEAQI